MDRNLASLLLFASCLLPIAAGLRAQAPAQSPLLGTWRSAPGSEGEETLTFCADRTLRIQDRTLRWSSDGPRLVLSGEGGSLQGTWQVRDGELLLSLELPNEGKKSGRYVREPEKEPETARLRVGRASFAVPAGWAIARENADCALLNPGFAPTDTLDALVLVLHGSLEADERQASLERVVRARLPRLTAELREQAIVADLAAATPRRVEVGAGEGVVVEADGRAGGKQGVRVWLGAVRDEVGWAAVLGVLVQRRASEFVGPLRRMHETLAFAAPAPAPVHDGDADAAALAGLEFGRSTFGSGGNSLTSVYSFGGQGRVTRRTMFSSSIGSSDSSETGTWAVAGETVRMVFRDGATEARLVANAGRVEALVLGSARYARL